MKQRIVTYYQPVGESGKVDFNDVDNVLNDYNIQKISTSHVEINGVLHLVVTLLISEKNMCSAPGWIKQ